LEKVIFTGHGIRVLKIDSRFFIDYDAGGIAVQIRQVEVSEQEAERAQLSERDAYEVLITK
jgi:hypothetical protein